MGNTDGLAFRIHTLAASGQTIAAKKVLKEMQELDVDSPVPPMHQALALLGTGNREAALERIEQGFAEHDVRLIFMSVESRWLALGERNYGQILERAGLASPSLGRSNDF